MTKRDFGNGKNMDYVPKPYKINVRACWWDVFVLFVYVMNLLECVIVLHSALLVVNFILCWGSLVFMLLIYILLIDV
jgi:hypothetical protein